MTAPESHPGPRVLMADEVAVPRATLKDARSLCVYIRGSDCGTWSDAEMEARALNLLALLDEVPDAE